MGSPPGLMFAIFVSAMSAYRHMDILQACLSRCPNVTDTAPGWAQSRLMHRGEAHAILRHPVHVT